MTEIGVHPDRIGESTPPHGIKHAAFQWQERTGGGVSANGRITLDSGIFNSESQTRDYGEDVARLLQRMRPRPRMEAISAHELAEAESGIHEGAPKAATETRLKAIPLN
jgi:hypothetical protein